MSQLLYYRPQLTGYQQRFLYTPARFTIIEAATKTGKTTACLVWLFEQALRGGRGEQFWWVAPTKRQAQMAFRRMCRMLGELPATLHTQRQSIPEIELWSGALLSFRTGKNPDYLYGEDVHAAVLDEASRCEEETWVALRSTLTATGGPAKLIGNVVSEHNWMHRLAMRARREGEAGGWAYFRITADDAIAAGVVRPEEIADARLSMSERQFRALYYCEPPPDAGNPFGHEFLAACTLPGLSGQPVVAFGADLARHHDYTAIVGLDARGHVAVCMRFRLDWGGTFQRLLAVLGQTPAVIDSTGVGDPIVEQLRRHLPRVRGFRFSAHTKQQLMEDLAMAIQQTELRFPPGDLADELRSFRATTTPSGTVQYGAPAGQHDDLVCALALAWHCFRKHRTHRGFDFMVK
jgi:phage FluMu gp28-like protein